MRWVLLAAALALPFQACAAPKDDLIAVDKAFAAMSRAKGPHAAFLAYMADDVRLYDGDHPPILGKAAVAAYYAANPDSSDDELDWAPEEAEVSPDGALGYTRGIWVYTGKNADGSAQKVSGYYVTCWRKQADGQYKFTLDIGGTDRPAQDPAATDPPAR